MKARWRFVYPILAVLLGAAAAPADLLSDEQLYYDPAGLIQDYYPKIYLSDLALENSVTLDGGADPVVSTNILPVLKPGAYGTGYTFSQDDYYRLPNLDYFADLTGGSLTAWFDRSGLYHVRATRASGAQEIYAVYAQGGPGPDDDKTGSTQKMDVPEGDLFLVIEKEGGDEFLDNAARALEFHGRTVKRVKSRADIETEIKKLTTKKHVEIVAHGTLTTVVDEDGEVISEEGGSVNLGDQALDGSNAKAFAEGIKDHVNFLTFVSCWVGKGDDGEAFLQTIADELGKAGGWDCQINAFSEWIEKDGQKTTTDGWFTRDNDGQYVTKVPEPATLFLLALGGLMGRRRRAA